MEDARASTSSQGLARTFDTLIESPKSDIAAIAVFRSESLTTGNNRDIPVSLQELVYGSKAARVVTSPKSLDRHHELISSRKAQQIKAWLKNQSMLSEDQKKKWAQGKENSPVEAPQASTSAQKAQENPKDQPELQAKGKGKGKAQMEQALLAELQDSKEREDSHV
ncbi:hypothetical protein O181_126422 [Austropuccinia psidii MF-1]|uniref:Uncharacterized protein n=1 Tax=Austropuccinia psidii MF-1 TaxID=1389203 RepID=A0A9Q3KTC6_9BASI|nr:hypothetical protein [Austropuccinia psidii MF-1]